MAPLWIDTHCHVIASTQVTPSAPPAPSAPDTPIDAVHCVFAATSAADFEIVRQAAHASGNCYALGIHPLHAEQVNDDDLACLEFALRQSDPRLVAVGEIGLDQVASASVPRAWRDRQNDVYVKQLTLARRYNLPVVLHSRGAVDLVLAGLRRTAHVPADRGTDLAVSKTLGQTAWRGVAHAFNGSLQQAKALMGLGLKLGFGRALTHERALHLRRLAEALPLDSIVLETDATDSWATDQHNVVAPCAELPRIGAELAALRSMCVTDLAQATTHNALTALPGIRLSIQ